jgi:arginyl-tRNA synthetase
MFFLFVKLILF